MYINVHTYTTTKTTHNTRNTTTTQTHKHTNTQTQHAAITQTTHSATTQPQNLIEDMLVACFTKHVFCSFDCFAVEVVPLWEKLQLVRDPPNCRFWGDLCKLTCSLMLSWEQWLDLEC